MSDNLEDKLCAISVNDERKSTELYEIEFKNELISILCKENMGPPKYVLEWSITKNIRQLLKSESTNTVKRYEETLVVNFSIYDSENKSIILSDTVRSKGAYNILEDEFISTFASKVTTESQIAVIAAKLTLDKIHLFMLKNENSKF
jgi:rRNA processing protein Krr1/Pno1